MTLRGGGGGGGVSVIMTLIFSQIVWMWPLKDRLNSRYEVGLICIATIIGENLSPSQTRNL